MPQHLRALLSSSARLGKYRRFNRRYFSNRLRKPATGSFAAEMDGRSARPFSLWTPKRTPGSAGGIQKPMAWKRAKKKKSPS